jgi:hypothetical protein
VKKLVIAAFALCAVPAMAFSASAVVQKEARALNSPASNANARSNRSERADTLQTPKLVKQQHRSSEENRTR